MISRALNRLRESGPIESLKIGWFFVLYRIEHRSPDWIRWPVVQLTWLPYLCFIYPAEGCWVRLDLRTRERRYVPDLKHHERFRGYYSDHLEETYTKPPDVVVEAGDVVFDVGSLTGDFTRMYAPIAKTVIAVEPNPISAMCVSNNTRQFDNVIVEQRAAYKEPGTIEFQLGTDRSEDSIMQPDDGGTGSSLHVQADTIENIAQRHGIDVIDFLKLDAEGAEPEVIEGLGEIQVRKLAISTTGERPIQGEDEGEMCAALLEEKGYEILQKRPTLFAVHPDR